ncbi:hypothetical protein [Streptomyces tsukubensis]|uniref:hypothetical protein n=1 Tax=Streptomyces tsukubensis TaxID=83656 RepID=UPI00344B5F39
MIKKILLALARAVSREPDTASTGPSNPMSYRWRCECGAKSRYSDIKAGTEYNARRHQWRFPAGHPKPEVYAVDEA